MEQVFDDMASENGASGAETEVEIPVDIKTFDITDARGDAGNAVRDKNVAIRVSELELELKEARDKNDVLQRSLDDLLSEIYVAKCVKESMVELERQNATRIDEVATLQHLLNETTEEASSTRTRYEHEFARLQAIVDQLEHENKDLRIQLKVSEKSILDSGGGILGATGVDRDSLLAFSDVTKSFARKVKSNFQQTVMNPQSISPAHQATSPVHHPAAPEEDSMKRAYEDTELLKSIVVPLEEQIQALKDKLRQTDALLREHESRQAEVVLSTESLGRWLNGQTTDEASLKLQNEKIDKTDNVDTYVGLLVARLALLTAELDSRRRELSSVVKELEKSRKNVAELRKREPGMNAELLRHEQRHLTEICRISSVLNDSQKNELAKLAEKDLLAGSPEEESRERSEDVVVESHSWNEMQKELSRLRTLFGIGLNDGVVGSDVVRRLRSELDEMQKDRDRLAEAEAKLRSEIQRESEARKEIESMWNEKAEIHKTETEKLSDKTRELEGQLQNVSVKYNVFVKEMRKELEPLIRDREKIVAELKRLQRENDQLVGLHDVRSTEMQNERIDLPDNRDDMQLLLLTYREELINAKVAKEHYEERLKSEVNFLKSQLLSEQQTKESLEDRLAAEMESLREKVFMLESCKTELDAEQKRHREFAEHELSQRQAYAKLQRQIEMLESEKRQTELKIHEFKARITNLQQELDNSVAVQNDFVRLSQSLQMELEKIRSQSTEVRWQHEDDVDECNSCKHGLPQKRKIHCRHCGKIFCPDCLTKTVPSGPHRRPARVCEVCHTLLVQHSAPYFSTEAPHMNDR